MPIRFPKCLAEAICLVACASALVAQNSGRLETEIAPYRRAPHRELPGRIVFDGPVPEREGDLLKLRIDFDEAPARSGDLRNRVPAAWRSLRFSGWVLRGPVSCGTVMRGCTPDLFEGPADATAEFLVGFDEFAKRPALNRRFPKLVSGEYELAAVFLEVSLEETALDQIIRPADPPQLRVSSVLKFRLAPIGQGERAALVERLGALLGVKESDYELYQRKQDAIAQLGALETPEALRTLALRTGPGLDRYVRQAIARFPDPALGCGILSDAMAQAPAGSLDSLAANRDGICQRAGLSSAGEAGVLRSILARLRENPLDPELVESGFRIAFSPQQGGVLDASSHALLAHVSQNFTQFPPSYRRRLLEDRSNYLAAYFPADRLMTVARPGEACPEEGSPEVNPELAVRSQAMLRLA